MALREEEQQQRIAMVRLKTKAKETYRVCKGRVVVRDNELLSLRKAQQEKLKKFGDVKNNLSSDAEYSVVLEKFNLEIVEKQQEIQKYSSYRDRASSLFLLISAIENKDKKSLQEGIQNLLGNMKEEIMSSYKSNITILRQKKAVYNRENAYLNSIRKKYPKEYEEKIKTTPTQIELDNLEDKQYNLEKEQKTVNDFIEKGNYKLDASSIINMTLLDEDPFVAAECIYPGLEEIRYSKKTSTAKDSTSSKTTK